MDSRIRLHGGRLLGEGEAVLWGGGTGDHKGRPYGEGDARARESFAGPRIGLA